MNKETDQYKKMRALLPAASQKALARGLQNVVERYGHKARHTGDKAGQNSDQILIKEALAATRTLVRFADLIEHLNGYEKHEFDECYAASCKQLRGKGASQLPAATALIEASATAAAAIKAYKLSHSVITKKPKSKPRLQQIAPTMELIGLWERLSGKKMTTPKAGRGKNGVGTNANKDAEFVYQGLRLINPRLSEPNGRTLIKAAIKILEDREADALALFQDLKKSGAIPTRSQMLAATVLGVGKNLARK